MREKRSMLGSQGMCSFSFYASDVAFLEYKRVEGISEGTRGKVGVKEGESRASTGQVGVPHQRRP